MFDVTIRRPLSVIWVTVLVGLIAGILSRVVLTAAQSKLLAQRRALDLRSAIAGLSAQSHDDKFSAVLRTQIELLDGLSGRATARNQVMDTIQAAVTAAQSDLNTRLLAAQKDYLTLAGLDRKIDVPVELAPGLAAVQTPLSLAAQQIQQGNAVGAASNLSEATTKAEYLKHAGSNYLQTLREDLGQIVTDVLYGTDWIGDANGIFAVFTWAFAINLTIGTVTSVLAGVKQPATGG